MIAQAFYVIDGFLSDVIEKGLVSWIQTAAKHEILPDHNPQFIAKFVEIVTLINSTTPHSNHVHVAVPYCLQQLPVFLLSDARGKTVGGNPVSTFCKDRNTVNHKGKTLATFTRLLS